MSTRETALGTLRLIKGTQDMGGQTLEALSEAERAQRQACMDRHPAGKARTTPTH